VLERRVKLVDRLRAEGVTNLGAVEGDAHGADLARAMVGDVFEREAVDRLPFVCLEDLGNRALGHVRATITVIFVGSRTFARRATS